MNTISRLSAAVVSLSLASAALAAPLPGTPMAQQRAQVAPAKQQYRIGAGDTLRITVYQSPDLSLETKVTDAGVISYPLLGSLRVAGLSVDEAEAALAQALVKGDFIKNPQVIIVVTNVRASQVNVLGQVGKPGRYPLDIAGMRLTEVLALAGGVSATGADTVVLVGFREGKPWRQEVDLPRLFAAGGLEGDLVIMPGDAVWVDRAPQIYVYGEVQRPGQVRLERGMTVMQALAAAGGKTQRGTERGLRVSRRGPDGRTQSLEPGMDEPVREGDVVYIRESLF